ncbi:unknown [Bacteroides finegoldii CAG:203]|nr:unknown [Bacteroides finegoldii CAG:203]
MYPAAPCEICAVPVFPETWNCLLPAGLASPSPTTLRNIICMSANVLSEHIFGLITSVGYSFTISPSFIAAFTNLGRTITPLLAIAL